MAAEEHYGPIRDEASSLVWRAAVPVILILWAIHFGYLTALRMAREPNEDLSFLLPRLLVTIAGIGFSFAIVAIQLATAERPLPRRVGITVACALAGSALHATVNCVIFYGIFMPDETFVLAEYLPALFDWMWFYGSLTSMILAISYSATLRDRDRRMADLAAKAHAAQIRALRYQLNPHFLFNTLNSVAALVSRRQNPEAEAMIENLSDFLRTSLALDPHDDITLDEEIKLQALYLDIERRRFPKRLAVDTVVPDELRAALVPSLITQPLVENVVKYAVARSTLPVQLTIMAEAEGERLRLTIRDDGGDAPPVIDGGTRVGLGNVANRLKARFDDQCSFQAASMAEGGFRVSLELPLQFAR
jgi:sensor histidine kinase YesM